jgi:hypothetical protein
MGDEIDGAIQQAPHPTLHFIVSPLSVKSNFMTQFILNISGNLIQDKVSKENLAKISGICA